MSAIVTQVLAVVVCVVILRWLERRDQQPQTPAPQSPFLAPWGQPQQPQALTPKPLTGDFGAGYTMGWAEAQDVAAHTPAPKPQTQEAKRQAAPRNAQGQRCCVKCHAEGRGLVPAKSGGEPLCRARCWPQELNRRAAATAAKVLEADFQDVHGADTAPDPRCDDATTGCSKVDLGPVAPKAQPRWCKCGCGVSLQGRKPGCVFDTNRCRMRYVRAQHPDDGVQDGSCEQNQAEIAAGEAQAQAPKPETRIQRLNREAREANRQALAQGLGKLG